MARPPEVFPRPLLASLIAFGALLVPTPGPATLFVYEPFDYAAPSILEGSGATGQNLTGSYTPVNAVNTLFKLRVSSPGLDYGELVGAPVARGHKITQFGGTGPGDARIALAQPVAIDPGQAIFFSARFTFDDSSNGTHRASIALVDDGTLDEIAFGEPVGGIRALRVAAQTAATGGTLRAAGLDLAFENGQSLLLVGRYVNSPAAQGDVLEVIGYDTAQANVLPPSYDAVDPNKAFHFRLDGIDIDLARVSSVRFEIRGDDNNHIDELRIGSGYTDVAAIPEPGSWLLMLCGLVALGAAVHAQRGCES